MENIVTNLNKEACKEHKLKIKKKAKQAYARIKYAGGGKKSNNKIFFLTNQIKSIAFNEVNNYDEL